MLGATVVPVTTGSRTLKDAINEALRDWVTNVDNTHYLLGTAAGPHPFPAMVRDFVRGIGVEARAAVPGADRRGCPTRSRACVGGGSNAIGIFHAFVADDGRAAVRLRGRRRRRRHRPARGEHHRRRRRACCTAPAPTCCRTRTARPSSRTRSRPAWTTRASGPEHAWLHDTGRATLRAGHRRRGDGRVPAALPHRGHHPGDRERARAGRRRCGSSRSCAAELGREPTIVVNLSGRGDKDVDTAGEYFGMLDKE